MNVKIIKSILVGMSLFIAVSLPLSAEDRVSSSNRESRFKIFIAEHNVLFKGKHVTIKSIFKMDRDTGIVWRYRQGIDSKGKPYEEFFEVPNQ